MLQSLSLPYGVPEELSSDGDPRFISTAFTSFLEFWGVQHRFPLADYPQCNGRAELGVKASKRIIDNTVQYRTIMTIMQYHNTPLPRINLSPDQILLHS